MHTWPIAGASKFSSMSFGVTVSAAQCLFLLKDVKSSDGGRCYTAPHCYLGGMKSTLMQFRIFSIPIPNVVPI